MNKVCQQGDCFSKINRIALKYPQIQIKTTLLTTRECKISDFNSISIE
jgi:hypothetical protein